MNYKEIEKIYISHYRKKINLSKIMFLISVISSFFCFFYGVLIDNLVCRSLLFISLFFVFFYFGNEHIKNIINIEIIIKKYFNSELNIHNDYFIKIFYLIIKEEDINIKNQLINYFDNNLSKKNENINKEDFKILDKIQKDMKKCKELTLFMKLYNVEKFDLLINKLNKNDKLYFKN